MSDDKIFKLGIATGIAIMGVINYAILLAALLVINGVM